MLADILHNIPKFLRNQWLMGVLKGQLFGFGPLNFLLVLVGYRGVPHIDGMPEIYALFQNTCHCATTPVIRSGGIQIGQRHAGLVVIVITWIQNLLCFQLTGNLIRTSALGTQLEYMPYYIRRLTIGNNVFCIVLTLFVAIRCSRADSLTAFSLGFDDCTYFPAGIFGEKIIEEVPIKKGTTKT